MVEFVVVFLCSWFVQVQCWFVPFKIGTQNSTYHMYKPEITACEEMKRVLTERVWGMVNTCLTYDSSEGCFMKLDYQLN